MLCWNWNKKDRRIHDAFAMVCFQRVYRLVIVVFFLIKLPAFLFFATSTVATEIEPRVFSNAPVGINFLLTGYAYTDGGLATVGSSPVRDAQLRMHTIALAYARTLDCWGKSGKFDVIIPYSNLTGSAMVAGQQYERDVSGFHDPLFRLSVNFYGAPALPMEKFAKYRQDLIIGVSLQVSAPFGQYDDEKLVNLGNNRWFIKPVFGISKALGPFTTEISAGMTFFEKNDDYFGGKTLEQDPLCSAQLHVTYSLGRGVWAALSGTFDFGGRTTTDGVRSEDSVKNSRAGFTLALPVNRNNSIKFYASTSIRTSIGNDYSLAGLVWQYRWGNGL